MIPLKIQKQVGIMLSGVHFISTFTCNFECDHCFLYCSPNREGTFKIHQIQTILEDLTHIGSIHFVSFEGGEPFLYYGLLRECIRRAAAKGFETAIETNCYWATSK
jgi:organic radical activating enzyme